jgi:hypothetical protein
MTEELWLPCPGYEGLYEVSSLGKVRSPRKIMVGVKDSAGYPTVQLYREGVGTRFKVHRLVCEAFNGPCPEGHECGHLDGSRDNAAASNLAWITRSENTRQAISQGTHRGFQNGSGHRVNSWRPITTAPKDGSYMLLRFDGPFHDQECPGVAVGKALDRQPGYWLTAIWAASTAHCQPTHWMPLPEAPLSPTQDTTEPKGDGWFQDEECRRG